MLQNGLMAIVFNLNDYTIFHIRDESIVLNCDFYQHWTVHMEFLCARKDKK